MKLCLKSASEAQTLLLSENDLAETSIPIINASYLPGSRGGFSNYSQTPSEIVPEKEMILFQDVQGTSSEIPDLEDLTDRQIAAATKDTERTLLIRLVFSALSEDELYEKYEDIKE